MRSKKLSYFISFIVFSAIVVGLYFAYQNSFFQNWDQAVMQWAANLPSIYGDIAKVFTYLGSWIAIIILGLILAFIAYRKRGLKYLIFVVLIIISLPLLVNLLKYFIARPRPDLAQLIAETGFSFPSAHAAIAMGMFSFFVAFLWPNKYWGLKVFAVILAVLVGFSRIILGVHFLTDVVAGLCFGLAWLSLVYLIFSKSLGKSQDFTGKITSLNLNL